MAQTSIGMPQATGDQLFFFYDARDDRAPFLTVANPSDEIVLVEVVFYGSSLQELDREDRRIPPAGNVVIDPKSDEHAEVRGEAGIAVVTPLSGATARRAIVPSAPLAGSYSLADTTLRSAFGGTAFARRAVDSSGNPAEPGTLVDGTSARYQRFAPTALLVPTYFNPQNLGDGGQEGNRLVLVAFEDDYGPPFAVRARDLPVELVLCRGDGQEVARAARDFDGILSTSLGQIAGEAPLDSSGKVFVSGLEPDDQISFFGIFSQGLDVFAMGHALPDLPSIPECGTASTPSPGPTQTGPTPTQTPTPTPRPSPTPEPTATCGNGMAEPWGGEACDGSDFVAGRSTCAAVVLRVTQNPGCRDATISCASDCRLEGTGGCDCPCDENADCWVPIDCTGVVTNCVLSGHCSENLCVDEPPQGDALDRICRERCG